VLQTKLVVKALFRIVKSSIIRRTESRLCGGFFHSVSARIFE